MSTQRSCIRSNRGSHAKRAKHASGSPQADDEVRSAVSSPKPSCLGFSLLEVILATAIIAASSMVLLRLISTGEQHLTRGERKVTGQRICQSIIDQMIIDPELQQSVENQAVNGHPQWTYTAEVQPSDYEGLIRVRVRAAKVPRVAERTQTDGVYDFELIRWMRTNSGPIDEDQQSEQTP